MYIWILSKSFRPFVWLSSFISFSICLWSFPAKELNLSEPAGPVETVAVDELEADEKESP